MIVLEQNRYETLNSLEKRIGRLTRRAVRLENCERERRRIMCLAPMPGEIVGRLVETGVRRSQRLEELHFLSEALHACWMAIHDRRPI